MSKSIFETLGELENDNLWFPEVWQSTSDLRIEARSNLKGDAIDVMIREKLSDVYVLENMQCKSYQDIPPTCFGGPWSEAEIEYWRKVPQITYYTFNYAIDSMVGSGKVSYAPVDWITLPERALDEPTSFADPQSGQDDCPDCKDGFYYPFAGPREPCQTCRGKAASKSPSTPFDNAFKLAMHERLLNIDLSPMPFSLEYIPNGSIWWVKTIVRDSEDSKSIEYFYDLIVNKLKQDFRGGGVKLDFGTLNIDYDVRTSRVLVTFLFVTEAI